MLYDFEISRINSIKYIHRENEAQEHNSWFFGFYNI